MSRGAQLAVRPYNSCALVQSKRELADARSYMTIVGGMDARLLE
jgi:hypothetical protein